MNIAGCVALVTNADAGLGPAFVASLLMRGATKIYIASDETIMLRDLLSGADPRLVPMPLDVTDPYQVAAVARVAGDVTLLINNASVAPRAGATRLLAIQEARRDMEANHFGVMDMMSTMAPILGPRGGALVNVLLVPGPARRSTLALMSAAHDAVLSLTSRFRSDLAHDATQVIGVLVAEPAFRGGEFQWRPTPGEIVHEALDAVANGTNGDIHPAAAMRRDLRAG